MNPCEDKPRCNAFISNEHSLNSFDYTLYPINQHKHISK